MEIDPASLPQLRKGRGGRVVFIDNDALGIVKKLRELHPSLRLAWNEVGEYFTVYQMLIDGEEHLVLTAKECDERIIKRVRLIMSRFYNFAEELDRLDKQKQVEADYQFNQRVGEYAEQLAHAVRKDIGAKNRIFVNGEEEEPGISDSVSTIRDAQGHSWRRPSQGE